MQSTPQSDFASLLTNLGSPTMMDASAVAAKAITRYRRRIRSLVVLTIGLWLIDFLLVPALWMPFAAQLMHQVQLLRGVGDHGAVTVPILAKILDRVVNEIAVVSGIVLAIMTLASLLAAISTVWLVLTVRRVTLEQLTIGLTQIAAELHRLEKPSA